MADDLTAWVAAAQGGDDAARAALLAHVRRGVMRYLIAQRHSRETAEDLAQEVCIAVLAAIPTWRETGKSFWGFVFTVAKRKAIDAYRSDRRRASTVSWDDAAVGEPVSQWPGPEDSAMRADGAASAAAMLDCLPERQREVLVLRAVVGLSAEETAVSLGLARGSVHVLQHRALTTLRKQLGGATARLGEAGADDGSHDDVGGAR